MYSHYIHLISILCYSFLVTFCEGILFYTGCPSPYSCPSSMHCSLLAYLIVFIPLLSYIHIYFYPRILLHLLSHPLSYCLIYWCDPLNRYISHLHNYHYQRPLAISSEVLNSFSKSILPIRSVLYLGYSFSLFTKSHTSILFVIECR